MTNISDFEQQPAQQNMERLSAMQYPGRGIILGVSPDGEEYYQVYWLMGRRDSSRNRQLVQNGDEVRTEFITPPEDGRETENLIYSAFRQVGRKDNFLVSNGRQTEVVADAIASLYERSTPTVLDVNKAFVTSLEGQDPETDGPIFTPRITGYIALRGFFGWSLIRRNEDGSTERKHEIIHHTKFLPGYGLAWHTYQDGPDPVPSFKGLPYPVPLMDGTEENLEMFWNTLNPDNRVAIAVQAIRKYSGTSEVLIKNKYKQQD